MFLALLNFHNKYRFVIKHVIYSVFITVFEKSIK